MFPAGSHFWPLGFLFLAGYRMPTRPPDGLSRCTGSCISYYRDLCMETNLDDPNLQNFQCSVTAPATGMEVPVFVTNDVHNYDAYTLTSLIASPSVIYALGVKMVYQATDLPTRPTTSIDDGSSIDDSSITTPTISSTSSEVATGASLATGAVVAIGVTIPLAVLGASVAAFLVWRRKRRQRQSRAEADDWLKSHELPTKPHERLLPKRLYEMSGYGVMAEMPAKRETVELPG
ncbi:hypothetical protein B0I37DRAFT_358063 [Chaetomium sp. MPI-CAGE-AT-0009]|nr:hypothetical protein B0I37DRAFT_358063 [Chaetomium sp. MPI-CAGE-AT-0009]